ncbi:hypothetical protein [Flavobacterium sp.]|uniref:hypothetical protein n=1 Tax=Flavobacterium sp. TaxID=239 RepID=UPI0038FC5B9B
MIKKIFKSLKLIKIDVVIYAMTKKDILPFPDLGFEILIEPISKGKKKYFILDKGVLVHNSFLLDKVFLLKLIRKKGLTIGDCYTHPDYRGKSIYPFVIHFIAKKMLIEAKNSAVFVIVNRDNASSIKGIEKSGCKKIASIEAKRWLWFYFDKNIKNY